MMFFKVKGIPATTQREDSHNNDYPGSPVQNGSFPGSPVQNDSPVLTVEADVHVPALSEHLAKRRYCFYLYINC